MKRSKNIVTKPVQSKDSSEGADSDEEPTKPTKKVEVTEATKMSKPVENEDSDTVSTSSSKRGKTKGKRTKSVESDTDNVSISSSKKGKTKGKRTKSVESDKDAEKSKQITKNGKVPGKSTNKRHKSVQESPSSSDVDSDEAPSDTKTKEKVKKANSSKQAGHRQPSNSDSEEKTSQPKKKVKTGKTRKSTESPVESKETSGNQLAESKQPMDAQEPTNNSGALKKEAKTSKPEESDGDESDPDLWAKEDSVNQYMQNLESLDPPFFKFLSEHDKGLLQLEDADDILEELEDDDRDEKVHVPGELHGDSDESDFEDNAAPIKGKVTIKMVREIEKELHKKEGKIKLSTIILATKLFNAAVTRATSEDCQSEGEYKVSGSSVFNAIVNMCVLYLPMGIQKFLGMENSGKDPQKCKHFVKIKGTLVQYLNDLMELLSVVTSDNILSVMLKHLHQISRFLSCFSRIAKKAIKTLLPLWSSGEETVRVLAFVCILRISRYQKSSFYELVLKAMFMSYMKNCKFVSPSTWPGINFMRRSLAEFYMLDTRVSYHQVFLYIRQLGIHLRNAIVVPRKEHTRAVLNWQFVNSLHLWASLFQQSGVDPNMRSLQYPLTMIISNTIKLVPTAQYYPLRFLLTDILIEMSRETGTFVPILGFMLDVLTKFDFNAKHKKVSMKPMDFSCLLRVNKSQMSENGFKDAVVDRLYASLLEYMSDNSHTLAFPDVTYIVIVRLKDVVDKCTVSNYKRKFKQLLEKIEENAEHIRKWRYDKQISMRDINSINALQTKIKVEGTPLSIFYENWNKLNNIQKRKVVAKNEVQVGTMPTMPSRKMLRVVEEAAEHFKDNTVPPMTLFPSDSEDEIDHFKIGDENKAKNKIKEKKIKKKKNVQKSNADVRPDAARAEAGTADAGDIVKEFSASDW